VHRAGPDRGRREHVYLGQARGAREPWVKPTARWRFRTIDGRTVERDVGEAIIECLDERATTIVVFAERGDAEVLGVYALEGLGLEVDPVTRQLRKVEALLAV